MKDTRTTRQPARTEMARREAIPASRYPVHVRATFVRLRRRQ